MNKILKPVMVLTLSLFLVSSSNAQEIKKVAQTGLQFLKVDMLARGAAMGGALTMPGTGASSMFYNPAGLADIKSGADFVASNTAWIAGIGYNAAAAGLRVGTLGTFGVSAVIADYGDDIIGTRVNSSNDSGYDEVPIGDVGAQAIGISYARSLTDRFQVGGQVKFASQALGSNLMPTGETKNNDVSGAAFDFGTIFYPGWKSLKFGMSIRNFSQEFKYENESFELPLTFTIGTSVNIFDVIGGPSGSSLLLAVDAIHPRDYTERIHAGLEYSLGSLLAVRAGYKTNYDEESLSFGFGVNLNVVRVDYSYSQLGVFDGISRITIGGSF